MKKIKKKKPGLLNTWPAFVIGWTHGDPPPPGFLTAWFNREYGGPLGIRFSEPTGHHKFQAVHTSWAVYVDIAPTEEQMELWKRTLHWEHSRFAFVSAPALSGHDRCDPVLHCARVAQGLTVLTEGTAYDVGTGQYLNPSDWKDRDLSTFKFEDHLQVEQQDRPEEGRVWIHTRGLVKFGWDELEAYRPVGVTDQECRRRLLETAGAVIRENRNLKVGECLEIQGAPYRATATRHRTDPSYGRPLAFREIVWS